MNKMEKKLVPKLRFPEFIGSDGWQEEQLGKISEIVRGGSPRPIQDYLTTNKDGLNWLKIADVPSDSKYIVSTKERVVPQALSSTRQVADGDLILSNSMSFGRPYILKITTCIHDGWIAIRKISKLTFEDYLYYFISSELSQGYFNSQAAGAAVKNLNAEIIKLLPIYFSKSKKEQQKIADCLSSLDDLITAESEKLDALQNHKKGLMQQLFPAGGEKVPKLRFPEFKNSGEWEYSELELLTHKISDGIHTTPIYDDRGEYFFINGNNFVDGRIYIDEKTKKVSETEFLKHKKDLSSSTIFMSINGTIGNIATFNNESIILGKSACYININRNKVSRDFIVYLIQTETQRNYFNSELTGSTIKNLSLKSIKGAYLPIPCRKEQQKIVDCLSFLDRQILEQNQKVDNLKIHKKGLMQQLFPTIN